MDSTLSEMNKESIEKLQTILDRLEFETARNLARNGFFRDAQMILTGLLRKSQEPHVLDLLARIYAQQGRIDEAKTLWEKAILLDPTNAEYAQGMAFISKMQQKRFPKYSQWKRFLLVAAITLPIIVTLATLIKVNQSQVVLGHIAQLSNTNTLETSNTIIPQSTTINPNGVETDIQNILMKVDQNQQSLTNLETAYILNQTPEPSAEPELELLVNVPGTTVEKDGHEYSIRFDKRLFLYGNTFSDKGKDVLLEVGRQLEPYIGKIQIKAIGFTDALEKDTANIPIDRGSAVVKFLVSNTRLTFQMFSIASGEGLPSPFPIDAIGEQYKERTVLLIISPFE